MRALRLWLVRHDWFIIMCDPAPDEVGDWKLRAVSPQGVVLTFFGDATTVKALG